MATLLPSEQLAASTVRIECIVPGGTSTGTGFFFAFLHTKENHAPAKVTNKHVVAGATAVRFFLNEGDSADHAIRDKRLEIVLDRQPSS